MSDSLDLHRTLHSINWQSKDRLDDYELTFDYIFKIDIQECYEHIADIYQLILPIDEVAKAARFKKIEDFKRFLCARYSLRIILSAFLNIKSSEIVFKFGIYNKPYLDGIDFNLSHCGDFVVIAVSETPVGIDIELIKDNFNFMSILPFSFTKSEITKIENDSNPCKLFYWLWTRKEALLKATGEGIIDNMDEVSVLENKIYRLKQTYNLISFEINKDYMACFVSSSEKRIKFIDLNF